MEMQIEHCGLLIDTISFFFKLKNFHSRVFSSDYSSEVFPKIATIELLGMITCTTALLILLITHPKYSLHSKRFRSR